jgi:DoxX-like protein
VTRPRIKALTGLQWTLGLVILIEALLFVMPGARHTFAATHMPDAIRLILGWGEIAGAILLLIPQTAVRGAWALVLIFVFAILIHLLHGMFEVGNLVIYTAAAWAIATGKLETVGS